MTILGMMAIVLVASALEVYLRDRRTQRQRAKEFIVSALEDRANRALYAVDPAFAVELGYTPPAPEKVVVTNVRGQYWEQDARGEWRPIRNHRKEN